MTEYRMKTGKIGEKVVKTTTSAYKKIEDSVVGGYKKIEDSVVGGYKKIEDTVVGGYKKIENAFVDTFLEKVEDEKAVGPEEQADGESARCAEESAE